MKAPYICLLLAGLTLPWVDGCSRSPDAAPRARGEEVVPVSTAAVTVEPVDRTIPVVGTLHPLDQATLAAEVEGRVEQTMADLGDRLAEDQLLAQIDTTTYEALARQATANLARAKASAANARQELKRAEDLKREQIASASALDKAFADAEQADAEVKAEQASEGLAQLNLHRSLVRAPFAAAVAERVCSAGDYVKAGSPLFRLVNDNVLKYMVHVPENYAGQIHTNQPILFSVDAYPGETFEGRVYQVSPQVSTATCSFRVGALVPNAERRLKANSYARGHLVLQRSAPTTLVPMDAVVVFAGVTKVFVITNEIARSRQVAVGRINRGQQEVLSGLKPGETVATSGQTKLYDGVKVRLERTEAKPLPKGKPA